MEILDSNANSFLGLTL